MQGPGDRVRGRLLLRRRRPPGRRHGEPPVRVHGAARADPWPEHAGRVARARRRRAGGRVPAALPPAGVGDGRGAGRRRLLRLRHVVPGQQGLRQGAAQGGRLRRAAGPRPFPLQQRHGAGGAVRHAQQPEPRPGAPRRRALWIWPRRRPPRQDVPYRQGDGRQDRSQVPVVVERRRI